MLFNVNGFHVFIFHKFLECVKYVIKKSIVMCVYTASVLKEEKKEGI